MDPVLKLPEPIRAWLESRPRLRPLKITFQKLGGRHVYVLENPRSSAFYLAGEKEFRFLECLDGQRSVAEVLARGESMDPAGVIKFLEMLRAEGLLDEPERPGAPGATSWLDRIAGILFWRIPLGNPDRFFIWLSRWFGWAVHPIAWLAGVMLMGVGALTLLRHADRIDDATMGVLAPQNWLWLGLLFVALRVIHEIWHGLTCRYLGARVRDIGVVLIVFVPLGYTDVTAGWGLPSRWHRFLVSVAGIFIEMVVAAAAAIVWANTDPGVVNTLAWQTVLTAGATTLLANANPLMRFDGYYIMTDLLDLPNLYTRGQIVVRAWMRRYLLGLREQPLPSLRERGWWAAALYGPASLVWRFLIVANILAAAGALGRGAGILLVCVLLAAWGRKPVQQLIQGLRSLSPKRAIRPAVAAVAVVGVLLIPWRTAPVEPALVDWADRCDVYAGCAGIVESAPVAPGQSVEAGAPVAHLANADLVAEQERLRLKVAKEELRGRMALREGDLPGWAAADAARVAYQADWDLARTKAERRSVTAPAAGIVYDHRLDRRLGQHVREGELLFTLGHPSDREVVALIPQDRLALYGLHVGDAVEVWIPGRPGLWNTTIGSLSPAARRQIDRPALTALGGGHLAVQQTTSGHELYDPQFEVRVRLLGPEAVGLRAGERGFLRARGGPSVALWRHAYGGVEEFWSRLLGRRV